MMTTNKKTTTNVTSTVVHSSMDPHRSPNVRMTQNFHLIWLDKNTGVKNDDYHNYISKFREVVNSINIFIDVDECIDFITDFEEEKALMVISGEFIQTIIPVIQDIVQVHSIFIFSENKVPYDNWAKEGSKVNGVYTNIASVCETLKQTTQDCDQNAVSISFVKKTDGVSKPNLDQLDQSFMYTQILKEILLTINFQQEHINEFLAFCREQFIDYTSELRNVEKLEKEYHDHKPIWWYTCQCFLYSMLNKALRTMEVDLIIKMGFFVRDLHNHIATLHTEQYGGQRHPASFIVYRGQGLSLTDFRQMKVTQGGLLAFNNFLSTSHNRDVSLKFVRRTLVNSDLVGVLFVMRIDPSISTTPFANVKNVSCYQREDEILFSMHSVFRIVRVEPLEENERLWQVELTLTGENDPQLHDLTESMRKETNEGGEGWYRLSQLLIKLGQFDKAEGLCEILLQQTKNELKKGHLYNEFGRIKHYQGKYAKAVKYYKKSIELLKTTLPANHPDLGTSYNNSGLVYKNMGEYSKALSYYDQALEIFQKTLPANHPNMATSYNNIGVVYQYMGEYSKALSYYEQALEIKQETLPANHPSLATSYNNIGRVYYNMGEYSKALSYYEQALETYRKTLPANHPDLAASYNNIGVVHQNIGDYSKALLYLGRALDIFERSLPPNHPDIQMLNKNIDSVKKKW